VQFTDSATPPHPVLGANVAFESILALTPQNQPIVWIGDTGITGNRMPVILSSSQTTVSSDANGQATLQPSTSGVDSQAVLLGTATAGSSSLQFELQLLSPLRSSATNAAKPVSNLRKATAAR
jgi:hypothetical protein